MIKRYFAVLLAMVVVFNTAGGLLGTITYAQEQQDETLTMYETDIVEESTAEIQQDKTSDLVEELSEVVSEENSTVDEKENDDIQESISDESESGKEKEQVTDERDNEQTSTETVNEDSSEIITETEIVILRETELEEDTIDDSYNDNVNFIIEYRVSEGQENWGTVSIVREEIQDSEEIKGSIAKANDGYEFVCWIDDNGNVVCNEMENLPTVAANCTYYAMFMRVEEEICAEELVEYNAANPIPALTGNKRLDIAAIANSQVGVSGGSAYGSSSNWCAFFAKWCVRNAGGDASVWPDTGSTNALVAWFQNRGQWHNRDNNKWKMRTAFGYSQSDGSNDGYTPQPGDFAAIENSTAQDSSSNNCPDHTALVYEVKNGYVYTIEGNVGGGYVKKYKYDLASLHFNGNKNSSTYIVGFGEPAYGGTVQSINKTPIGYLDSIKVSNGAITIAGWARDDNDSNRAVEIIMEVGGTTYTTTANRYRDDVGSHGFEAAFNVNCYGTQTVNVYMIDADINQKFLLNNGNRTVTVQRPFKIEYGVSQVDLAYEGSQSISFAFQADGVSALDIATGDGRIAQARFRDIDWTKGTGYVDISSGYAVGETDLTIAFLDNNNNKIYKKSIPVKVTGEYNIDFSNTFNYVREKEECIINFKVTGKGISQIDCEISDKSSVMDMGWRKEGYNQETGEGGVVVKGLKEGGFAFVNIRLWDVNGKMIYLDSCNVIVTAALDVNFKKDPMNVYIGSDKSYQIAYKGYGVADIAVASADTDIAKVTMKSKDTSNGKAEISITGCDYGKTKIIVKLLDFKGRVLYEKSADVIVQEPFDIKFKNSTHHIWKGETQNINFSYEDNYDGMYGIEYVIEQGEDVVQIVNYGGGNDTSRWIAMKGLESGVALLTIRFSGLSGTERIVLYEESITILVFELKVSPESKTSYVGETFQIDSYCEIATPSNLKLSYTSSDSAVASVNDQGVVTAKKKGKADIIVATSDGKQSAVCELTVVEEVVGVTGLTVFPVSKELTLGETFTLKAVVQPANATDNKVSYSSSDISVATVDEYGRIKAIGTGNTRITVTSSDGSKKAYCDIIVNPAVIASGKTGELDWKITGEAGEYTLTISGSGAMADYGGPETESEPDWYQYHADLKYLVLEEGITKIGENAFSNCDSLSGQLRLPLSLKTIGESAFYKCTGFKGDIFIPDGVEQIESGAFRQCSGFDGNLNISDSVTVIGDSVFAGCSGLSGILTLPAHLTSIEQYAFNGCYRLSGNLTLPEGLTKIESFAFQNCSGFTGDLIIPNSVLEISEGAFYNCTGFNRMLKLSEKLMAVEANSFKNTRFSNMVTIPAAVTRIGANAFYNIPKLKVYFEGNAPRSVKPNNSVSASFPVDVQIYYNSEKSGWSTPEWNAYTAEPVSENTPFDIPVEGIGVGLSGEYLCIGDSFVMEYWLIPENTTERDVIWESSNISVATVDENGRIEAVGYGEAVITATTKNGKYSQTCDILVVKQPDPTLYVKFDEENSWMWVGETKKLKFRLGGRGFVAVGQTIYDSAIAECVNLGDMELTSTEGEGIHQQRHGQDNMDVKGNNPGKTKVSVQLYDGRTNMLYQNFMELTVADLQLSDYYIELKNGERSDSLEASVYPEIGKEVEVQYKSSDETVVSVDQEGVLTAIKPGVAMIIVTTADGAVSKYCDVLVYEEGADDKENRQLTIPAANVKSGSSVEKGTKIVLSSIERGDIYYTIDGTAPTKGSTLYTQPIEILTDTTIKAFVSKEGYTDSKVITLAYRISKSDNNPSEEKPTKEPSSEENPSDEVPSEENPTDEPSTEERPSDEPAKDKDDFPYTDSERQDLSSLGASISNIHTKVYSRDEYEPAVKVTAFVNGRKVTLTEGMDYRVSYKDNINAGTATVTIKGNGEYKGSLTKNYTISPKSVKKLKLVTGALPENEQGIDLSEFPIHIYDGTKRLSLGTDYTLSSAGMTTSSAKVTIIGKGNYTGATTAKLTIYNTGSDQIINPDNVRLNTDTAVYTGKAVKTVEPVVTVGSVTLAPNKDYKVQYKNNTNAGTAYVIVTGKGAYKGKVVVPFTIRAASVSSGGLIIKPIPAKTYSGKLQKPAVTVTVQNGGSTKKLVKYRDYKVTYKDNLHAGTATAIITGKGNYAGMKEQIQFTINPQKITKAAVKGTQEKLTLTYGRRALKENTHYEPPVYGEIKKNKVKVTIKGKGDFTGEITKYIKQ